MVFAGEVGVPFVWRSRAAGRDGGGGASGVVSIASAAAAFCPIVGCEVEWLVAKASMISGAS